MYIEGGPKEVRKSPSIIYYIVVQSLVINIGICFASSYNVFRADDLSYGNVFRERSSRKTSP